MADLEDRRCLDILSELLQSDDVVIRVRSNAALVALTQNDFQYIAYADEEERAKLHQKWVDWIGKNKATLKLHLPLDEFLKQQSYLQGKYVDCAWIQQSNRRTGPSPTKWYGNMKLKRRGLPKNFPMAMLLIAAYRENKVIEVDMNKKIVWEAEATNVLNAKQLPNGNVLMCLYAGSKVQEITREKKVVWEYQAGGSLADAIRLANGNTVIATNQHVAEIDPKGKKVWEYEAGQAYGVSVTSGGTLLISQLSGKVVEVDMKSKEEIWSYNTANPVDAFRLNNGNTLITNSEKVVEVEPDGKVVWEYARRQLWNRAAIKHFRFVLRICWIK